MGRAPCCDKVKVKKGAWSPEEDSKLKAYIEQHGTGGNWIALPQKVGLRRCGKSCRFRWLNYLRPNIRHGGFSKEEDNIIYNLYASIGSRWSIIAAQLPGRTDNDVKNHWNTKLKKRLLEKWEDQQDTCLEAAKGTEVSQTNTNTSLYRAQPTARVDQIMNMNGPVPQLDEQTRCIEGPTIADADPLNLEKAFDQERLLSDHDFAFRTLGEELEATLFDNPITTDQMVTSNCISDNSNACPMFYSMQDACTIMLN